MREMLQTDMSLPQFELGHMAMHVMHCWAHVQSKTECEEPELSLSGARAAEKI